MSNVRDPRDVINAILPHIPIEMTDLRKELKKTRDSSVYLPPEYKWPAWINLTKALEVWLHIPPATEWEQKVHDIMKGKAG